MVTLLITENTNWSQLRSSIYKKKEFFHHSVIIWIPIIDIHLILIKAQTNPYINFQFSLPLRLNEKVI